MFKKLIKFAFISGFVLAILGILGWLIVKSTVTAQADKKASAVIASAYSYGQSSPVSDDQKVIAIAREIFNSFQHKDPATIPLLKVRGYITNDRLPSFLRLGDGVIETHMEQGYCDNASRMLAFILKQEGFSSVQRNMVTNSGGHSALLVTLPNEDRDILVDPFYGYVTTDLNGELIHPHDAKNLIENGDAFEDVFTPLGEASDPRFYKDIRSMFMGAEGQTLTIEATLPHIGNNPIHLGKIDGKYNDVKSAASQLGITPYWYYMGHKYNREWVRVLKASQPVKIVMTLTEQAEDGILTSTPKPSVDGQTLTWELNAGEEITFRDGLAKISLKRMNSYIPVDQTIITFTGVASKYRR